MGVNADSMERAGGIRVLLGLGQKGWLINLWYVCSQISGLTKTEGVRSGVSHDVTRSDLGSYHGGWKS